MIHPDPICPVCGSVLLHSHGKLRCSDINCHYYESCSDGSCGCTDKTAFTHTQEEPEKDGDKE